MKILFLFIFSFSALAQVSLPDYKTISKDFTDFVYPLGERVIDNFEVQISYYPDNDGYMVYYNESINKIFVFKGVIENNLMTKDALAMILCHEIGHNLKIARHYLNGELDYAFEHLEQDYFAAKECFIPFINSSDLLKDNEEYKSYLSEIPIVIQSQCYQRYEKDEAELCLRSIHAGYRSIMGLFEDFTFRVYEDWGIPAPNWNREWLGPKDDLQARIYNFINASLGEPPFL